MRNLVSFTGWLAVAGALAGCGSADPPEEGRDFGRDVGSPSGFDGIFPSTPPDYPEGPYGTTLDSTLADNHFLGWRDPTAAGYDVDAMERIGFSDFYNKDGKRRLTGAAKEIKLILVNVAGAWCPPCKAEYAKIKADGIWDTYREKGAVFVGALFQDVSAKPVKPADLSKWAKTYSVAFPMIIDPGFKTGVYFTSDAVPLNMLVRASDMRILYTVMGGGAEGTVALLKKIDAELDKIKKAEQGQ